MPSPPTPNQDRPGRNDTREEADPQDLQDLQDLPPLDGDAGETSPGDTDRDDEDLGSEKSPGGLDDATGEDDEPHPDDLEVDAGEGRWLDESADAPDLDLGDDLGLDLSKSEPTATADTDDAGPAGEDPGVGEGLETRGIDTGEEGPEGPDEELRDQDLPDLGAAEEDEIDDGLVEADRLTGDDPMALKWASTPWARVGAPVPFARASAVACAARGALVAGRGESRRPELVRVDLEGACQAVAAEGLGGADIRALSVEGEVVAVIVDGGGVFLSRNAGTWFEPLLEDIVASDVVVASGILWVRSSAGGLYTAAATSIPGTSSTRLRLEPFAAGARVGAIAQDGAGQVLALLVDAENRPTGLLRGKREGSIERETLECTEPCGPGLVAAHGEHVAYAARRGVVRRGGDGVWREFAWDGTVVALAFVDADGGLVAAIYSDTDDTTGLVQVDDEGAPRLMAVLGPTQADIESDGRASAIACDEPRGVVWIAGGFGVAAFSIR